MIAYPPYSRHRVRAAFALREARRQIAAKCDREGIDVLFDAIEADLDQRRFAYTLFELAAAECVSPLGTEGFATLESEGDLDSPDAQVSTWCARFITAAANGDEAACAALFESIDDAFGSACLGYIARMMTVIWQQRKLCEQ